MIPEAKSWVGVRIKRKTVIHLINIMTLTLLWVSIALFVENENSFLMLPIEQEPPSAQTLPTTFEPEYQGEMMKVYLVVVVCLMLFPWPFKAEALEVSKLIRCGGSGICLLVVKGKPIPIKPRGVSLPDWPGGCDAAWSLIRLIDNFIEAQLQSSNRIEITNLGPTQTAGIRSLPQATFRKADIFVDGKSLSTLMIEKGLGSKLSEDHKKNKQTHPWCERWK